MPHPIHRIWPEFWSFGSGTQTSPLLVQPEQPRQNFIIGKRAATQIIAPAIGLRYRLIERLLRMGQPSRPRILEVGQRALGQFLGRCLSNRMRAGISIGVTDVSPSDCNSPKSDQT